MGVFLADISVIVHVYWYFCDGRGLICWPTFRMFGKILEVRIRFVWAGIICFMEFVCSYCYFIKWAVWIEAHTVPERVQIIRSESLFLVAGDVHGSVDGIRVIEGVFNLKWWPMVLGDFRSFRCVHNWVVWGAFARKVNKKRIFWKITLLVPHCRYAE